jgi:hypothetical protein
MADPTTENQDRALDGIAAVAPAGKGGDARDDSAPAVREAADAESVKELKRDPSDPEAKLHVELDESFPGSDAPSTSRPGSGEPAPSSGYDPEAEKARHKAS